MGLALAKPEKETATNVGKTAETTPNANVGKLPANVLQMPTLAKARNFLNFNTIPWRRKAVKPPAPNGVYWQPSGSKTTGKATTKKRILVGWTRKENTKCQPSGE